ncbi:MAG: hypothetical protein KDD25_10430, partial [Bdellovibrionales bacterium]|nr:hypothetical protein [Bdellovibrionales bacterium]
TLEGSHAIRYCREERRSVERRVLREIYSQFENRWFSTSDIIRELSMSKSQFNRVIKEYLDSQNVEVSGNGRNVKYRIKAA